MKKSFCALVLSIVMVLSFMAVPAYAANVKNVETNLPEIKAEVKVTSGTELDKDSVKATLDGQPLSTGDIQTESASTEWIVMLDTSLSLSSEHFQAEKKAIKSLSNSLGEKETLVLYTFDTTTSKILSGSESKTDAAAKIDAIKANGQDTAFYKAVTVLTDEAKKSEADNTVAVIYTDGVETLAKSDKSKASDALSTAGVPVYGLYPDVTSSSDAEALDTLLKKSDGGAESFTVSNASDKLSAYSKKAETTAVITFNADSDIAANENAVLSIDLGNGDVITETVAVDAYTAESSGSETTAETSAEDTSAETAESAEETTTGASEENGETNLTPIIIAVIAVLIILFLVIVLLKKKGGKKEKAVKADAVSEEETAKEDEETEAEEEPAEEPEPIPEEIAEEAEEEPETVSEETAEAESTEPAEEAAEDAETEEEEHEETEEERAAREEAERIRKEKEAERASALAAARERAAARAATVSRAAKEARASAAAKAAAEEAEKEKLAEEEKEKARAAKERAKQDKKNKKKMKEEGANFQFYFVDKNDK